MAPGSVTETARALAADVPVGGARVLLGLTGSPGAGKSTYAAALVAALTASGRPAVLVPMDGFHLHDAELDRLGRRDRKGAPDTFDVAGYVALLRRLHEETTHPVYAPEFVREREESVAGAIAVLPEHVVVVTEGNYLLHGAVGWQHVRPLLDAVWFLRPTESLRLARLVARHESHGRSPADALAWATGSDQANADLVAATAARADRVIEVD